MFFLKDMKAFVFFVVWAAFVWGNPGVSSAQEAEVSAAGKPAYDQNCAVCHGTKGKGEGGAIKMLTMKPTDLTQISKRNDGTFPFWRIYRVIDGREEIKGHGTSEMPIWGTEFRYQAGGAMPEAQARGR